MVFLLPYICIITFLFTFSSVVLRVKPVLKPSILKSMAGTKKKRERALVPSYRKVYSVYQYDREKFARIYKKLQAVSIRLNNPKIYYRVNPYKILSRCYVLDEEGYKQSLGDERHIFRYKVLQSIFNEIGQYLIIAYELLPNEDVIKYLFKRTNLILYESENSYQAELYETIDEPIKTRIKTHITLLRGLYKGLGIEEAVRQTKEKHKL